MLVLFFLCNFLELQFNGVAEFVPENVDVQLLRHCSFQFDFGGRVAHAQNDWICVLNEICANYSQYVNVKALIAHAKNFNAIMESRHARFVVEQKGFLRDFEAELKQLFSILFPSGKLTNVQRSAILKAINLELSGIKV